MAQTTEKPEYKFEDTRISTADTLLSHKQYADALKAYQTTLTIYTQENFYEGMVYAMERVAYCHRRLGDIAIATRLYQMVINLAKEELSPNHMLLSKIYFNNALRLYYGIKKDSARFMIDASMDSYFKSGKQNKSLYKKLVEYKFHTYYHTQNSPDTIFKYLGLRNSLLAKGNFRTTDRLQLLTDYTRAFEMSGDFDKSENYALKAVRVTKENLDKVPKFRYVNAMFLLGKTFISNDKDKEAYQVSNEILTFIYDFYPESPELVDIINMKAVALNGLKRYDEAQLEFLKVIRILEDKGVYNTRFYNSILQNLGVSYHLDQQYDMSGHFLNKALKGTLENIKKGIHDVPQDRYDYLSQLHRSKGEYDLALLYCDSAISSVTPVTSPLIIDAPKLNESNVSFWVIRNLINKSKLLLLTYKSIHPDSLPLLHASLKHVSVTHSYIIKARSKFENSNSKITHSRKVKGLYEVGLNASYTLFQNTKNSERINDGLKNMIRSKSLLFLDQVKEYVAIRSTSVSNNLRTQFALAKTVQDSLDNQINQQISIDPLGDSVMILNTEKMKWNARLAEVRETIERDYPQANDDLLSKDVSLSSLRADHQLSSEKALVEYFVGDSIIFVVGLSGEKESFHRIKKDEKLNEALSGVR